MDNYNFTTLNNPKHFVALGKEPGKAMNLSMRTDIWSRINTNFRRSAGISPSYYSLVPTINNRSLFNDMDIVIATEGFSSNWKSTLSQRVFSGEEIHAIQGTNTFVVRFLNHQINIHVVKTQNDLRRALAYLGNQGLMGLVEILGESLGIKYDMNNFKLLTGVPSQEHLDIPYSQYLEYRLTGVSPDFVVYHLYSDHDIFKAVYMSQFFNRQVFLDLESKPDYAERVAKNPQIKAFVDYLKGNPRLQGETKFDPNNARQISEFTNIFKAYAGRTFNQYEVLKRKSNLDEMVGLKFTSEKMAAVTGLEGDKLKRLMDVFAQEGFSGEADFNMFIITSLPETINARILTLKEKLFKDGEEVKAPELEVKPKKTAKAKAPAKAKAEPKAKVSKAKVKKAIERVTEEASDNSFALAA